MTDSDFAEKLKMEQEDQKNPKTEKPEMITIFVNRRPELPPMSLKEMYAETLRLRREALARASRP